MGNGWIVSRNTLSGVVYTDPQAASVGVAGATFSATAPLAEVEFVMLSTIWRMASQYFSDVQPAIGA